MQESLTSGFEQCMKCSICTEVCPMMEVNPLYPGPKHAGPDALRYRMLDSSFFDENLKYCLNCKRCEVACPSGVKIADIIASAKLENAHSAHALRDKMLASTDFVGSLASPFAPVVNGVLSLGISKSLLDSTIGVSKHASMPKYSSPKFVSWFKKQQASQKSFGKQIQYFHGCYVNYNYPQLGKAFVSLMNACGYGVSLLEKQKCCGVALIANGQKKQALKNADINLQAIGKAVAPVLSTSSSCTLTIREEYGQLLGKDTAPSKEKFHLAVKWLYEQWEKGAVKFAWREDFRMKAAYHTPCHMQKLGYQYYSIELLKMIPGLELSVPEQQCCGIAGTFGFKKEYHELSQKIGSKLFSSLKATGCDYVITDCETCKWQIEAGCSLPVLNPIEVLARALDIEKTKILNNNEE